MLYFKLKIGLFYYLNQMIQQFKEKFWLYNKIFYPKQKVKKILVQKLIKMREKIYMLYFK